MITDKQTIKPQFAWHKIQSDLTVKNHSIYRKISLKPNLTLTTEKNNKHHFQTHLHIDIEKSLQYQQSIGWNWHKSSNLPIFSIKLTIFDKETQKILIPPKLKAQIFAVKIVQNTLEKDHNLYLEDIGIKGQNKIQILDGCGSFNSLRFSSTSYNNEGSKFHLLIVVFSTQNEFQLPQNIFCSVISPPIFVDSRKSARNYQEKKYLSFVELFNPSQMQKFFSKKQNKEDMEDKRLITNDDEGLYSYLTAPNIRHKLNNVMNRLQKKLIKEVGIVRKKKNPQSINEKQFVILMEFTLMQNEKEKITEMLQYLDCYSISVMDKQNFLQTDFIDISSLGDIISVYKMEYFSLKKKSDKQIQERKNQQLKKQEEQNLISKQNQFYSKPKSLFDRIKEKGDEQFSDSYQNQNNILPPQSLEFGKQKTLNTLSMFGMGTKRIKPNQNDLFCPFYHQEKYPLYENFPICPRDDRLQMSNQNYRGFLFNFAEIHQNNNVKKQEHSLIYVSERQVVQKIQQMCVRVYQRNKKSILNYLETLKKSNIKWRVKDIEHFIFSYSSALMNEIFFREKLLHHMFLQNEIMKAKVGMMQQMAVADLEVIKGNILGMNKFLPEKFITDKLRENSLWIKDLPANEPKLAKVAEIRPIQTEPSSIKEEKVKKEAVIIESKIVNNGFKMIEEMSSSEQENESSFKYECKFSSNVFEFDSPEVKE